jgi:hypothetical protein
VVQLDIYADDLVIVPFDAVQLFRDMEPEVIRHLDIATPHDYVHATSLAMIGFRQPLPGGVAAKDAESGFAAMDVALPPGRC